MLLSPEQIIIFLRLVKKYKLLWNTEHPDYKNKIKQVNTWNKIATYFGCPDGLQAYRKYQRLCSTFLSTLSKLRQGIINEPNLFYFKEMEFLQNFVQEKENSMLTSASNSSRYSNSKLVSDAKNKAGPRIDFHDAPTMSSNHSELNLATTEKPSCSKLSASIRGPSTECTEAQSGVSEDKTVLAYDEFVPFAAHIYKQLRQMDLKAAMELMLDIQALVSKKRIFAIQKKELRRKMSNSMKSMFNEDEKPCKTVKFK